MGRGFGRGARATIVTHAQLKNGGRKTPRGLRGTRQTKRRRFQRKHDEQAQLEESLGMVQTNKPMTERSLAQQVASIQFQHVINKRQKGYRQLRRHILEGVRDMQRRCMKKKRRQTRRGKN